MNSAKQERGRLAHSSAFASPGSFSLKTDVKKRKGKRNRVALPPEKERGKRREKGAGL